MTSDGRRFLVDAGLALALLGVLFSALLNWFFSGLTFFGDPLTDDDYRSMALGFAIAAALLLAGTLPLGAVGPRAWVWGLLVVLLAVCVLAAVAYASQVPDAEPAEYPEPWAAAQVMAWCPTSWPLVVLLLATPWLRRRPAGHEPVTVR